MKGLWVILFLCTTLFALEYEDPRPNAPVLHQGISLHPLFPKVNPITGEYLEESCDLVVAGCHELSARRFYNHMSHPSSLYGFWRLNPESFIKANFEKEDFPLNVVRGEEEGGCLLLDGRHSSSYTFNPKSQASYTNLKEALPSGQTNPRNIHLSYHKLYDPKEGSRFQFVGVISDGSGKKTHFYTNMHKWHKSIEHNKGTLLNPKKFWVYPHQWIPYYCMISKEELPNGNTLHYQYAKYFDDKLFPSHYRIATIKAVNKHGDVLGWIGFEYPESKKNHTKAIKIIGSDKRTATCKLDFKKVTNTEVWINGKKAASYSGGFRCLKESTSPSHPPFSYSYDRNLRLQTVSRLEGRFFTTEYTADGKVHKQHAPVGPKGESCPIATFNYLPQQTHLRDAEGNLTIFTYDPSSRITCIEKFLSDNTLFLKEHYLWNDQGELVSKSLEDRNQNTPFTIRYVYDERGNVLEEHLIGTLTGNDPQDCYTLYRTYSQDGLNLKLSETDGSDKITTYHYRPHTNLLLATFTYEKSTLRKRTFHTYDESAICIKTCVDDGTSTNPDDLSGVTTRKITEMIPLKTLPCYGLPQTVFEKTLDASGQEVLLSRIDYTYHPSGKIHTEAHYDSTDTLRYTLVNTYDACERLASTTDALGHLKTFTYDSNFNLIREQGPQLKEWTYDKADRPIFENISGLITTKTYDKLGRLLTSTDPSGFTTQYRYDALGHLITCTHPDGGVEKKEYDIFGNVIKETDPKGYVTLKEYTCRGQPLRIIYPDGSEEIYRYNLNGTLAWHLDKNGAKTTYTYDIFQRPLKVHTPIGTSTSTYSSFQKLTDTDAEGVTTTYTYDFAGRKIAEKTAQKETHYTYDSLGRLTQTQLGDTRHIQTFDLLGCLIEKRREDTARTLHFQETYAYDEAGNVTHRTTCAGTFETHYNAHHLPIKKISPDGHITQYTYSYHPCYTITTLSPKGVQTVEQHDSCGRLVKVLVSNPHLLQHREFLYDLCGNQTHAIEHVYSHNTFLHTLINTWEYGPCNRVNTLIEANLKATHYHYDDKGRLNTLLKPDGTQLHHTYDEMGRLKTLSSKDLHYRYTYDKNHRLLEVEDLIGKKSTKRTYDPLGNLTLEILANGEKIERSYNTMGQKTLLKVAGTSASFTYNGGELFQIAFEGNLYTYQKRNLAGKPTFITYPGGSFQLSYDPSLRLASFESPLFQAFDYTYDPMGNLTHYTYTDLLGTVNADYTYDALNQLLSESPHTYTYDSLYNRLSKDTLSYTLSPLSQVTSDGSIPYTYDPNGNLIRAGTSIFTYDSLDRLIQAQTPQGTFRYTYDPFNRRMSKNGTLYLWEDKNEIGTKNELRILGEGLGAEIGATAFIKLQGKTYVPLHDHRRQPRRFKSRGLPIYCLWRRAHTRKALSLEVR